MTVWFVSRHEGAIEWMKRQEEWCVDRWVTHLQPNVVESGDVVIGTLPIHLAAEVCNKGAKFFFLKVPQGEEHRGKELSVDDMQSLQCELQQFEVRAL